MLVAGQATQMHGVTKIADDIDGIASTYTLAPGVTYAARHFGTVCKAVFPDKRNVVAVEMQVSDEMQRHGSVPETRDAISNVPALYRINGRITGFVPMATFRCKKGGKTIAFPAPA